MAITRVLAAALLAAVAAAPATSSDDSMRGVRLVSIVEAEPGLPEKFSAMGSHNTWSEHGRFTAEVPATAWGAVNASIAASNWNVTSFEPDMQLQIDAERAARAAHPYPPRDLSLRKPEFYSAMRDIEEVEEHIQSLVDRAPAGLTVERFVYGRTHFGREMVAFRVVGTASSGNVTKFWQHGAKLGLFPTPANQP